MVNLWLLCVCGLIGNLCATMRTPRFPVSIRRGSVVTRIYRLVRADGREVFTAAWNAAGQRHTRQFSSYSAAHAEASHKAEQLAAGKVGAAANLSGDDGASLVEARRICGNVPLLSALKEWARARDLTQGHLIAAAESWKARNVARISAKNVRDVVEEFCRAKSSAGLTVADNHASEFKAIKAQFGDQMIADVTARALDAWLAKWAHPSTRNTYRRRVSAVWRWAQKRGYLPSDVKTQAERTERAHEEAAAIGIVSVETFRAVLKLTRTKHPDLMASVVVAGFCGLRRSEVHAQTWEDVDLAKKSLRVTKAKRGTPSRRLVPLCDSAIEWLMLVPDRKGPIGPDLSMDKVRKIARDAEPKIELPENCFRHSFISYRVAETGNIHETSLEAGNSPQIVNKHYRELVTKDEGRAWFSSTPPSVAKLILPQ